MSHTRFKYRSTGLNIAVDLRNVHGGGSITQPAGYIRTNNILGYVRPYYYEYRSHIHAQILLHICAVFVQIHLDLKRRVVRKGL